MRILFVENQAVFARTVAEQFLSSHEVVVVPSLAAARAALADRFDAVLVDFDLDDGKGDTLVAELVAAGFGGRIVAVSGRPAGNEALLAAGAHVAWPKSSMSRIALVLLDAESR